MMYWRRGNDVEAAAVDGTQRRVLVTAVGDSVGLTIDAKGMSHCQGRLLYIISLNVNEDSLCFIC